MFCPASDSLLVAQHSSARPGNLLWPGKSKEILIYVPYPSSLAKGLSSQVSVTAGAAGGQAAARAP